MKISFNQYFLCLIVGFIISISLIDNPIDITGFGSIGISLLMAQRVCLHKANKHNSQHFWNMGIVFSHQVCLFIILYGYIIGFSAGFAISAKTMDLDIAEWQASLFSPLIRNLLFIAGCIAYWFMIWNHYQKTWIEIELDLELEVDEC